MATYGESAAKGRALVGKRIMIPVHYDMWMRGACYGTVTAFRNGKPGESAYVTVRLDKLWSAKRRFKVWALDFDYVKLI